MHELHVLSNAHFVILNAELSTLLLSYCMCLLFHRQLLTFIFICLVKKYHFFEPEDLWPCSEIHTMGSYFETAKSSKHPLNNVSERSVIMHLDIPGGPWGFVTKIVCASLVSSMHTTVPPFFILCSWILTKESEILTGFPQFFHVIAGVKLWFIHHLPQL
jgi:hypothetical protein